MRRLSFAERAERALIAALLLAILLIAQPWDIRIYRVGLLLLVAATLLQIAVGNLPKDAGAGRSLVLIALILAVVAAVFSLGIALTPFLSQLGR
jgi:ABC-type proline/glycine betaine transport system permease subunit